MSSKETPLEGQLSRRPYPFVMYRERYPEEPESVAERLEIIHNPGEEADGRSRGWSYISSFHTPDPPPEQMARETKEILEGKRPETGWYCRQKLERLILAQDEEGRAFDAYWNSLSRQEQWTLMRKELPTYIHARLPIECSESAESTLEAIKAESEPPPTPLPSVESAIAEELQFQFDSTPDRYSQALTVQYFSTRREYHFFDCEVPGAISRFKELAVDTARACGFLGSDAEALHYWLDLLRANIDSQKVKGHLSWFVMGFGSKAGVLIDMWDLFGESATLLRKINRTNSAISPSRLPVAADRTEAVVETDPTQFALHCVDGNFAVWEYDGEFFSLTPTQGIVAGILSDFKAHSIDAVMGQVGVGFGTIDKVFKKVKNSDGARFWTNFVEKLGSPASAVRISKKRLGTTSQ